MRLNRKMILGVAFPLALVLLFLNIVVAFANIRALDRAARQSNRSRALVFEVGRLISTVWAAEAGHRGYLLTGQEVYLKPYQDSEEVLTSQLDHLELLTRNDPVQRPQVARLRSLIRRKRAEHAHTIALRRDGKARDAADEVRGGQGRRFMDQAQQVAAAIEAHEQRSLARSSSVTRAAFGRTVRAVVFATALALGLLALALLSRRRERAERERQAEAIRQSEARLTTTFLSIGDAVISTDETGRIELMNPVAEAITGYALGEAVGRPITEVLRLMNETTRKPTENPAARVIREGVILGLANHTVLIARDGTEIPIDDSAAPIKNASGQVLGVIIVFRDISGRRRDEAEHARLRAAERKALAEAEDANRAKDRFLAILSHELRTPLNPIMLAVTSMLARPIAAEDIGPTLEMIRENVALEARLIDDLLDVMRIARGKMALHTTLVDCHSLIRHALQICQSDLQGMELSVTLELSARHHRTIGDATRLEQVFWNLIKNAVKFTPEGGTIEIRSWNEATPDEGGDLLIVEITDTGIGIEPASLPWIFDPFHQGDGSITRSFGGMGLGLAISQGVLEAHGGLLTAESPGKNHGSTFRVQLNVEHPPALPPPLGIAPQKSRPTHQERPQANLRIFLIEDEPTTLLVMTRLLRRLGHDVTTASTVEEALRVADGADFDVVVSDIGLPDGSGLDLIRELSANRVLPAIALTGFGMQEDIRQSREAGFAAHLTKPIDFAKLVSTIRRVAGQPKVPET